MNFITNNNAPDRKKLVKALAEHFDFDATYAGPPTFNYNVGDITVERDGQLATEDEALAARLKDFLIQNEWLDAEATEAPAEEAPAAEEPAVEAEPDLEDTVMKVGYPLDGMTVTGLTNLIHLLYSKQYLIGKSVREELIAITDGPLSPLHSTADVCLMAKSDMSSFVDSFAAPLSLINALIVALGQRRRREVTDYFDSMEQIWDKYDVYLAKTGE